MTGHVMLHFLCMLSVVAPQQMIFTISGLKFQA
jgi:hypothetical protein